MKTLEAPPIIDSKWGFADLFFQLSDETFNKILAINNEKYPFWDKWKYYAKEWNLEPEKLWAIVKRFRYIKQYIPYDGLERFQLHMTTPYIMQQQFHELDLHLGGSLHTSELIPAAEKQRYLVSSLMEEAIASSQIEGAATTRKLAREMLESNRKPLNHSELMIVNNYAAMQWIIEHKESKLSENLILELHRVITKDTLETKATEGAFRSADDVHVIDVQTNEVVHIPPAHDLLDVAMSAFCAFANDEHKEDVFLHPIAKAITLHFLIGYLHPFVDGNGRTARALFYWYLIRKGYWLIEYMSISRSILSAKAQYAKAYLHTELDGNDLTYFILYNLKAITQSLEELKKYIARKTEEKAEMLRLLRDTNYNDRQIVLIREIFEDAKQLFTVKEVETRFGVSNQTARNDLSQLVDRGVLETRTSGLRRTQYLLAADGKQKITQSNIR
jgi:Fic family protein